MFYLKMYFAYRQYKAIFATVADIYTINIKIISYSLK